MYHVTSSCRFVKSSHKFETKFETKFGVEKDTNDEIPLYRGKHNFWNKGNENNEGRKLHTIDKQVALLMLCGLWRA